MENRDRRGYQTDVTDEEWSFVAGGLVTLLLTALPSTPPAAPPMTPPAAVSAPITPPAKPLKRRRGHRSVEAAKRHSISSGAG
jgi:hypothetical protein